MKKFILFYLKEAQTIYHVSLNNVNGCLKHQKSISFSFLKMNSIFTYLVTGEIVEPCDFFKCKNQKSKHRSWTPQRMEMSVI